MKLKSIILGIAVTAVLLAVLVATRLMVLTETSPDFQIREIDTVKLQKPPSLAKDPPPPEDTLPPPPPVFEDLAITLDVSQPALPTVPMQVNPRLAVDTFFTDQPPAALPLAPKPKPRKLIKPSVRPSPRPKIKASPPIPKSHYSLGELDKKPRLLRNPSVTFPRSIKNASQGRVVVRIAILPSGRSQFVSIVSSTHSALNPLAKRIADGSIFTPPTRQGKPVKTVRTWPIIIKK